MSFQRVRIQKYEPTTGQFGSLIEVLFNPSDYRLTRSNQFAEVAIPGLGEPLLQFARGNVSTLTMQLFFDSYEERRDVRDYTSKITELLDVDSELHAPPVCKVSWSSLDFTGVLERADQHFTLFLPEGKPVRATVDVTFKQYFKSEKEIRKRQSANFAKRYTVLRGDTLSSIAGKKYGDPADWRLIATANGLDDALSIRPGMVLMIPPRE